MKRRIPENIRRVVAERASFQCEYCQVKESDLYLSFEVDHIISRKHGGGDELDNLAFACPHCNQNKGSDLTTFLLDYDDIVTLFNPRKQNWADHFEIEEGVIMPKTRIGEASAKLLQFNTPDRVIHRQILAQSKNHP